MDDPSIGRNIKPERSKKNKAIRCAILTAFNWKRFGAKKYFNSTLYKGVVPQNLEGSQQSKLSKLSQSERIKLAIDILKKEKIKPKDLPNIELATTSNIRSRQGFEEFNKWMQQIGFNKSKIKLKKFSSFTDLFSKSKEKKYKCLQKLNGTWIIQTL